ncbi:DsbA family protein [Kordiimonas sp. SCSIO 12603]|uniref:DsbA family protein n=1 Tax=Kordiimonas sp. SCSIO 12603 TaxID=2829596 RepID=UPI002105F5E1|nr:DsbA family protein [Kordiimonas sp. SCSIO 12603]UTW58729.1 DsbA family protein [Kordiimonas sp. SCSIO 12603]
MNIKTVSFVVALVLVAGIGGYHLGKSKPDVTPVPKQYITEAEITGMIAEYIKKNPEAILQSVNDYQQFGYLRQIEEQAHPFLAILEQTEDAPLVGDSGAPVKVIEFFDYQCPHCKANYGVLEQLLAANPDAVLLPKYLPILGDRSENDMSLYAAKAAEAARKQNKFPEFHKALLESRIPLSRPVISQMAIDLGLNMERFQIDIESADIAKFISDGLKLAEEIGMLQAGTPGYIIGGKVMIGAGDNALERLQGMVDDSRVKSSR